MKKIESILVAIERDGNSRQVVAKAVTLARRLGARLELFLGNAEYAYVQRHQYDTGALASVREACLSDSRAYLQELWKSLAANDLSVAIDAACESPGYEGIVHKVQRSSPDLVIRGMSEGVRGAGRALDPGDWELVRTCPAPLLLTRGKPWKQPPAFAAAIDIAAEESLALTRSILRCVERLAIDCEGTVDVLYAHPLAPATPERIASDRAALAERVREAGVQQPRELFVVGGEASAAIPRFVERHAYDLVALGALTHRKALTALVGTLTGRLLERLDSDVLLVKPPSYRSPVR
jgi:universal stress protein E